LPLLAAPKRYCGDNASMIAFAASFPRFRWPNPQDIFPKMPLAALGPTEFQASTPSASAR
ncbi:MAG: hypothetical protein LBB14_01290, partial [Puniceicoccales bacterium]|nr:hypothetical protein [Puniceicoccales bacterium]